jgi:hypothetical protein
MTTESPLACEKGFYSVELEGGDISSTMTSIGLHTSVTQKLLTSHDLNFA